jgi:hypothetical protein
MTNLKAKEVQAAMVFLRSSDDPARVRFKCEGESITEQSHKDECDMNYILRDYSKTGLIRHAHKNAGRYDDVSSVDFQHAMDVVADAKSMFESLPALVRAEFNQDVKQFLDFARDPNNAVKMQEMGITPGIDGIDSRGVKIEGMDELLKAIKPSASTSEDSPPGAPQGEGAEK